MHHFICFECGYEYEMEHTMKYYEFTDSDEGSECPSCGSENIDDDEGEEMPDSYDGY